MEREFGYREREAVKAEPVLSFEHKREMEEVRLKHDNKRLSFLDQSVVASKQSEVNSD